MKNKATAKVKAPAPVKALTIPELKTELENLHKVYTERRDAINAQLEAQKQGAVIGRTVFYTHKGKIKSVKITKKNVANFTICQDDGIFTVDRARVKGEYYDTYETAEAASEEIVEGLENELDDLKCEIESCEDEIKYSEQNIKDQNKEKARLIKKRAGLEEKLDAVKKLLSQK